MATSAHGMGELKRISDGAFLVTCAAMDYSYLSPNRELVPDIELRKDLTYEALADHCVEEWRKEGLI